MPCVTDVQELKSGLVIFRRTDVQHNNWYCRLKVPDKKRRYKTVSLDTPHVEAARDKAFEAEIEIRVKVKHEVPIFEKSFAQVAKEYLEFQNEQVQLKAIKKQRYDCCESYIRLHLNPYLGNIQIALVSEDLWKSYPAWRIEHHRKRMAEKMQARAGAKKSGDAPSEDAPIPDIQTSTIAHEMKALRAILNFAADKKYIRLEQVPRSKPPSSKARREEFTPQEYRHLHTFARKWIKEGKNDYFVWHRTMVYNFILIMANTGMRPPEASNLRWRDIDMRSDGHGRDFVVINVRGKDKYRELIATENVATYLDRIRAISKATKPDDPVFTNHKGKLSATLYDEQVEKLLTESKLLFSSNGSRRSTYCFRHTFATFRLMQGVDVYILATQMGTSVQMIEEHYGHITPSKNADLILKGTPGWEPVAERAGDAFGSVHADDDGPKSASRGKKGASARSRTKK